MTGTANPFPFDRIRLPYRFDLGRLQQETLTAIQGFPAYLHYQAIPLTVAAGRNPEIDDFSDPRWAIWASTPLLESSPYIQEVLAGLPCQTTNVRLLRLEPGGMLQEHTDPQLDLALGKQVRLHLPIFTNDQVNFILNGSSVAWQPGELWYLRLSDPHSVHNHSDQERIQLSIDVVVNDRLEALLVQLGGQETENGGAPDG